MWGPNDEMSFFLGWSSLLVLCIAAFQLITGAWKFIKTKRFPASFLPQTLLLGGVGVSLVLTLLKTQFLWELLPFARYIQFPWRILMMTMVFMAFLAGMVWLSLSKRWRAWYFVLGFGLTLLLNARYFQSEKYEDYSQYEHAYSERVRAWHSNNLYDYVPSAVNFFEKQGFYLYKKPTPEFALLPAPVTHLIPDSYLSFVQPASLIDQSTHKRFTIDLPEATNFYVHLAAFPGWQVRINQQVIPLVINEYGLVSMQLPEGKNLVEIRLQDTSVRLVAKAISLLSCLVLFWWIYTESSRRQSKVE
jgi:hypothetical protein